MAQCILCGENIRWDWDMDEYVFDDGTPLQRSVSVEASIDKPHITICDCGQVVSHFELTEDGTEYLNPPEWDKVDWQADENDYCSIREMY